jgi:hypothetical protein
MRKRGILFIGVVAVLSISVSAREAQARERAAVKVGQRGRGNAPPAPPHDPHDLTGIWNLGGGQDLSLSLAPPEMTPEGQKLFDANKPSYGRELGSADAAAHPQEHIGRRRGVPPAQGNDPIGDCNPLGWPRLFFFGRPVEMIQLPDRVVQFWEWSHIWRTIWTDGRPLPKDPDVRWYGYSVGKWEGDTFVVETIGVDGRTWIDHFGDVHSDDMHLTERYHRLDRDNMEVTMTLEDPKIYKKPWVSDKKTLRLQANHELREELCAPVDEESFNQRTRNPAGGVATKK